MKPHNPSVSTARVREAVLATDLSLAELAERLGWWNGEHPDTLRVSRRLGVALTPGRTGDPWRRSRRMRQETAEAIVRAAGLDPADVGL